LYRPGVTFPSPSTISIVINGSTNVKISDGSYFLFLTNEHTLRIEAPGDSPGEKDKVSLVVNLEEGKDYFIQVGESLGGVTMEAIDEWHGIESVASCKPIESSVRFIGPGGPTEIAQKAPIEPRSPNDKGLLLQNSATSLGLKELSFDDIYPVFHAYYDTHPLGKVMLSNTTGQPITDITVSFQIKEFMTDPKDCPAPSELPPGESVSVDLFGLFLPTILETTEKTKAQARVDVQYTLGGQVQHQSLVETIPILDRNATTWADNRRAAAFVTTKDPAVLTFSKNVDSMVEGIIKGAVNPNLLTAIAFFEAVQLYGLKYSQDPIPTFTANKQVADYIQFPRQTLQYKGGKCSDFSVLYSALLESVGIETAFITIPGHIFIALSAAVSPDEARKTFSRADDLIFFGDKSWIPVEVTEKGGFLQAWQDGAKEWRENTSNNQAAFYPLHDAWQLYEPVGLPGGEVTVLLPPSEKIVTAYQEEVAKFIDQEILPRVALLEKQITKAQDPRKPTNALGVLYAQYGQYDRAQKEFEKLLAKENYVPALLNMGNILYLREEKVKALDYYNRAYAQDPENPRVILAVARVNHDLENYFAAKKFYADLKERDPDLALQYAYLDMRGEEATRAAEVSGVEATVVWEE
jgi:tetratricopeptide (TPR) repeat protein